MMSDDFQQSTGESLPNPRTGIRAAGEGGAGPDSGPALNVAQEPSGAKVGPHLVAAPAVTDEQRQRLRRAIDAYRAEA